MCRSTTITALSLCSCSLCRAISHLHSIYVCNLQKSPVTTPLSLCGRYCKHTHTHTKMQNIVTHQHQQCKRSLLSCRVQTDGFAGGQGELVLETFFFSSFFPPPAVYLELRCRGRTAGPVCGGSPEVTVSHCTCQPITHWVSNLYLYVRTESVESMYVSVNKYLMYLLFI